LSGEDIDDLLPQFERRESEELFQQRKKMTIQNLVLATYPVVGKHFKVSRLEPRKEISVQNKSKEKAILEIEKSFYAQEDVDNYMNEFLDSYGMFDPNAFLVVDIMPFTSTQIAKPYPQIFDCSEVYDFKFANDGILEYLFVCTKTEHYDNEKIKHTLTDYYLYCEEGIVKVSEIKKKARESVTDGNIYVENLVDGDTTYQVLFYKTFSSTINKRQVQAKRIGYIKHPTNKKICVSPLHPAESVLRDLIRRKSELDVTLSLHVFPRLFQYGETCEGEVDIDPARTCVGGKIANTTQKCKKCNGSGFKPHRSAQDVILMKYPKQGNEFIPLRDLAFYLSPDLNVVDKLDEVVEKRIREVYVACFSASSYTKPSNAIIDSKNTNEIIVEQQNINNVLSKWAINRQNIYKFILTQIGIFNDTEMEVTYEYPKILESESIEQLLAKYDTYIKIGVSPLMVDEIEMQIAKVQMDNEPKTFERYKIQRMFLPFRGMVESQKQIALSSTEIPIFTKILYYNFSWIFQKIEEENKDFYEGTKSFAERLKIVERYVEDMRVQIKKDQPESNLGLLRNKPNE
jgi:hypothetical protein